MNTDLQQIKDVFELLSFVAILVGVPVGLLQYFRTVRKERQDREYGTYNALDEKYVEFQALCLERPYLDVFDIPDQTPTKLTEEQQKQELIAFTILFSIFERAYLMYCDQSTTIKKRQWSGWHDYIVDYCKRENFRRAWGISGATFDSEFHDYITERLSEFQGIRASSAEDS